MKKTVRIESVIRDIVIRNRLEKDHFERNRQVGDRNAETVIRALQLQTTIIQRITEIHK
jgi:hypothetical protein